MDNKVPENLQASRIVNESYISEMTHATHLTSTSEGEQEFLFSLGKESSSLVPYKDDRPINTSFVKGSLYSRIMSELKDAEDQGITRNEGDERGDPSACTQSMKISRDGHGENGDIEDNSIVEDIKSCDSSHDVCMSVANEEELFASQTSLTSEQASFMSGVQEHSRKNLECIDEWREVHDYRTGKTYFYNRRTRESRWALPCNGLLVGRRRLIGRRLDQDFVSLLCEPLLNEVSMSEITESDFPCSVSTFDSTHQDDNGACSLKKDTASEPDRKKPPIDDSTNDKNDASLACLKFDILNRNKSDHEKQTSYLSCMYCGHSLESANAMKNHLYFQCSSYHDFCRGNPLEHKSLQLVLESVWNTKEKINKENLDPYQEPGFDHQIRSSGETRGVLACISRNECKSITTEKKATLDVFQSLSDDEDTVIDFRLKSFSEEVTDAACAFCLTQFRSGTYLSRHLLQCKKRQRLFKKKSEV